MTTLRIAVIECGTLAPEAQKKYEGYYNLYRLLFESAARNLNPSPTIEVKHFDAKAVGDVPELSEIDAVLLTGSRDNSFDDHFWILELLKFVRSVLAQDRVRIIGICFGHQLLARALAGDGIVGRNKNGWELGVTDINLTERGQEIFGRPKLAIHQVHQDEVLRMPSGVELLGSSDICAIQSMYCPRRIFTMQGHPEFDDEILKELLYLRYKKRIISDEYYHEVFEKIKLEHHGLYIAEKLLLFLLD